MSDASIYDIHLEQSPANHTPLSPLSFIRRTAAVFPDHPSVIHGARRYTWAETYERCKKLGSALQKHGVKKNDTVAVMASNTPEMYECAFGPAMISGIAASPAA